MIDFVRVYVQNISAAELEQNQRLNFNTLVNTSTGEMNSAYKKANYKNLVFKVYEPTHAHPAGRIVLEGSLHKYWNNGTHNFNDFGLVQIDEVLKDLAQKFKIQPQSCILKNLELGVNITPPEPTSKILQYCLLHKKKPLERQYVRDEGNYKQAELQKHLVKFYDKARQYQKNGFALSAEIMRIEKRWKKMHQLNQLGIYSLAHLLKYGLENFKVDLLREWGNVLFFDWITLKDHPQKGHYSNPNFWQELKPENFKYHRKRLNDILEANPQNLKAAIAQKISQKVDSLNTHTTQITPLSIGVKRVG